MERHEPMHVLLVESDPRDARLLRGWLDQSSEPRFRVSVVSDLADANELASAMAYDAVVIDLCLPDGHGCDTVTRMREHAPDAAVVVLSDEADANAATDTVHQGAHEHLVKGDITEVTLAAAISRAIVRRRLAAGALKLAQQARASASRLRRLLHHVDEGVVLCDEQGTVEYCNGAAETLLGVRAGDMLPEPFARLTTPGRARIDTTSADGTRDVLEARVWVEPADSGVVVMLTRGQPLAVDPGPRERSVVARASLCAGLDCMGWRIERLRELLSSVLAEDASLRVTEALALGDDLSHLLAAARRLVVRPSVPSS